MALNRMRFMNTYVDNVTEEEAVRHIEECVKNRTIGFVVTPNVDQIVMMEKNLYFREICDNAELSVVDGHPLLWIAKWYKKPIKEKICGSDLMPHLCKIAAEKGYKAIFICGVPTYYPKFGFKTADTFGITMPDGSNFDAFMGYELQKDALNSITGRFYEADVLECDIHDENYMRAVDEFDKDFPYMEKKVLPHQWR